MAKKNPVSPILLELRAATGSEALAVEFMERHRWANSPACPRCGDMNVYRMTGNDGERNKDFRWRCRGCKTMYTVRTKSILEESRLPVRVWVFAFWKACASKKGISALQLSREMEITHRSALFVLRRIRFAMDGHGAPLIGGKGKTVEIDETYVGGRPRNRGERKEKAAVVAMAERDGNVRFFTLERVTANTLGRAIEQNVDLRSRLMTDESSLYTGLGEVFGGGHHTVKHSAGEYSKPGTDIHSNSVEGVFSLLKRGVYGTFHSVSKRHLGNYLSEFEFRHNARKIDDGERVSRAIKSTDGKRLTYRQAVDSPPWVPVR